jgi:hypothetical protein
MEQLKTPTKKRGRPTVIPNAPKKKYKPTGRPRGRSKIQKLNLEPKVETNDTTLIIDSNKNIIEVKYPDYFYDTETPDECIKNTLAFLYENF